MGVGHINEEEGMAIQRNNISSLQISAEMSKFNSCAVSLSESLSSSLSPPQTPASSTAEFPSSSCSSCPSSPQSCDSRSMSPPIVSDPQVASVLDSHEPILTQQVASQEPLLTTSQTLCKNLPISGNQMPRELSHEPLIPGLPDDLAMACLLRLPYCSQVVARMVCSRWNSYLACDEYISARRSNGLTEPWLLVLGFHKVTGKIQWQAWDVLHKSWHIMAPMPCKERICPPGFGCVAKPDEGVLFVCGGICSDMDCPMDAVLKYDLFKNRWTGMGRMSTPRSFFASGVIDGRIYAAGGNSTASLELSSAEVYDPAMDQWRPVASMGTNMTRYDSAILNGKLYVTEGWSWPFLSSPRGQIYDPKADIWESMPIGMREGWTGLSVVFNDRLYVISEHDSSKLKAFDKESDSWKNVGGAPMPSHLDLPISVNAVGNKLLVVARSLHIAVGTLADCGDKDKPMMNPIDWQSFQAPELFKDFIPSHSVVLYV